VGLIVLPGRSRVVMVRIAVAPARTILGGRGRNRRRCGRRPVNRTRRCWCGIRNGGRRRRRRCGRRRRLRDWALTASPARRRARRGRRRRRGRRLRSRSRSGRLRRGRRLRCRVRGRLRGRLHRWLRGRRRCGDGRARRRRGRSPLSGGRFAPAAGPRDPAIGPRCRSVPRSLRAVASTCGRPRARGRRLVRGNVDHRRLGPIRDLRRQDSRRRLRFANERVAPEEGSEHGDRQKGRDTDGGPRESHRGPEYCHVGGWPPRLIGEGWRTGLEPATTGTTTRGSTN
jgi:hypothetical protein